MIAVIGLDVQIISVTVVRRMNGEGQITTRLRLYNGGNSSMPITPDDLLSGQAADITLVWVWSGEPYGSFGVGA